LWPWTYGFCAQPQKFEAITVTIGDKNGQLLRLRVTLAPARGLDPWRWPKDCSSGDGNVSEGGYTCSFRKKIASLSEAKNRWCSRDFILLAFSSPAVFVVLFVVFPG